MKYSVQILGTGAADMGPSLLFKFDSQRYLVNCGEGTQRFAVEHKIRLPKLKNIFLTRFHWDTVGGLPGMMLTLSDAAQESASKGPIHVHGPPNTTRFMASLRHFIYPNAMQFRVCERADSHDVVAAHNDENLAVQTVLLRPAAATDAADGNGSDQRARAEQSDELAARYVRWLQGSKELIPKGGSGAILGRHVDCTVAYVLRGPEVRGKFDVQKARALGLKPGPIFGQLMRGENVTLPDGTVIRADQVVGPSRPGQIFVVLDLPTPAHAAAAHASAELRALTSAATDGALVFHMLGRDVGTSPEFTQYVADAACFAKSTRHFVLDAAATGQPPSFASVGVAQTMLHTFAPEYFPSYKTAGGDASALQLLTSKGAASGSVLIAQPLTDVQVEPKFAVAPMEPAERNNLAAVAEKILAAEAANKPKSAALLKTATAAARAPVTEDDGDWVVVPLGTGSAIPSKFRNVSSTLVSTPAGPILMDCGEGTLGQLARLVPVDVSDAPATALVEFRHPTLQHLLDSLKLIFVSHLHADHHLGLTRLLAHTAHPVTIVGPWRLWNFLREIDSVHPVGLHRITFVDAEDVLAFPDVDRKARNNGNNKSDRSSRSSSRSRASSTDETATAAAGVSRGRAGSSGGRKRSATNSPVRVDGGAVKVAEIETTDAVTVPGSEGEIDLDMDEGGAAVPGEMDVDSPAAAASPTTSAGELPPPPASLAPVLAALQLQSLHTVPVIHRSFSYGLRLVSSVSPADLSLVFSGDTRPCERLVALGRAGGLSPGLLIHEATFESDMGAEARKKQHSTTAEAVSVFERMGARALLLTHFSQRYPKLPKIETAMRPENVAIAFDHLSLPVRRVAGMYKYTDAVEMVCRLQTAMDQQDEARPEA
ncbi:hypothetical protein H9P43_003175 [Blastocladiella emersonii ATCC 22665]|nr:hypothetical protein H9P43_003175 [Blastocladiella emersonii ATCC 22665]